MAANIATAGQDDGYSGRILDKITRKWKPPHPLGKYRLNIILAIEGDGSLLDCRIQKSSGLEALDASACAAARAAAPFGQPPYGIPASIFFSFWSDNDSTPRTKPDPVAPDAMLAMREREAAIAANERAQAAAEAAARKTGKKLDLPVKGANKEAPKKDSAEAAHLKEKNGEHGAKKMENQATAKASPPKAPVAGQIKEQKVEVHSAEIAAASGTIAPSAGIDENKYAKYISKIRWDLRNAMFIPKETKPGTYHAVVQIECDAKGTITGADMLDKSGDDVLDRYVMKGIERAGKVVPPPPGFGNTFKIDFTLVRYKNGAPKARERKGK